MDCFPVAAHPEMFFLPLMQQQFVNNKFDLEVVISEKS